MFSLDGIWSATHFLKSAEIDAKRRGLEFSEIILDSKPNHTVIRKKNSLYLVKKKKKKKKQIKIIKK